MTRALGLVMPVALLAWLLVGGERGPAPRAPFSEPAHGKAAPTTSPLVEPVMGAPVESTALDTETPRVEAATTRVRVTVRLPAGVPGCGLPVPELHRLDENGAAMPMGMRAAPAHRHPALELAARAARGLPTRTTDRASRIFEIREPGRYVAAWHLWLQVPGTRTWRVQRGRGIEQNLSLTGGTHEVVVDVGSEQLELDPSLDARAADPHYRITAKDG